MENTQATQYAALVLRVSLGAMFIAHGLLKVLVAYLEIIGGALLIAGVATRTLSLIFLPILLGALWVHAGNGWVFNATNGGWEYPAFLAAAIIVQALLGDGAFALRFTRRANQAPNR